MYIKIHNNILFTFQVEQLSIFQDRYSVKPQKKLLESSASYAGLKLCCLKMFFVTNFLENLTYFFFHSE